MLYSGFVFFLGGLADCEDNVFLDMVDFMNR